MKNFVAKVACLPARLVLRLIRDDATAVLIKAHQDGKISSVSPQVVREYLGLDAFADYLEQQENK